MASVVACPSRCWRLVVVVRARSVFSRAAAFAVIVVLCLGDVSASAHEGLSDVVLSGDPSGELVTVFQPLGDPGRPLLAAFGSSGVYSRPVTVAQAPFFALSVDGNARGDAVAAWLRRESAEVPPTVTARTAGSRSWASPRDIQGIGSNAVKYDASLGLHINSAGDVLLDYPAPWRGLQDPGRQTAWRPAGGTFAPAQPSPGLLHGLDDRGEGVAVADGMLDGVMQRWWSTSVQGAPWTSPRALGVGRPGSAASHLEVNGAGLALAVVPYESGSDGSDVLSRSLGSESWTVEQAFPRIERLVLGDGGHAVALWTQGGVTRASIRQPDGTWSAPEEAATTTEDERVIAVVIDPAGAVALTYGSLGARSVRAAYRPPTGRFAHMVLREPPSRWLRTPFASNGEQTLAIGGGHALFAWQEADGESLRVTARSFDANGPGALTTIARQRQWLRQGPPSACRPAGSRTLFKSREARIFTTSHGKAYGCAYRRGRRYRLTNDVSGAPVALAGPLAATFHAEFDDQEFTLERDIWITDLRDPIHGIRSVASSHGPLPVAVALNQRGAIAWITCESKTPKKSERCPARNTTYLLWAEDAPRAWDAAVRSRQLASGTGIAPRSLRLRGSKLTWTQDGKRHTARLR